MTPLLLALCLFLAQTLAAPGGSSSTTPTPSDVCQLPADQGRCDAIKHRFAYDMAKSECVTFLYGGCGGNANNFVSLADCQAACPPKTTEAPLAPEVKPVVEEKPLGDQPASGSTSTCGACPNDTYLTHYQELGCTPIFTGDNKCCASSYDCGSRSLQEEDKCYHEGKAYAVGTEIPENLTPSCLVHCRCTKNDYDKEPRMNCVSIECPELFHGPLPKDSNCVRQFQKNTCCSTNTYCAPNGTALKDVTDIARCEYGGRTFIQGQKFYPEDKPCLVCICQPGFNGVLSEPHCERAKCNMELHYSHYLRRQCVPIYYQDRCCPIDWSCPDDSEGAAGATETSSVVTKDSKPTKNECTFGSMRFALGADLPGGIGGKCVKCTCNVPPVPTCVKNYNNCN